MQPDTILRILGSGSMEGSYLTLITLLDAAESLANSLFADEQLQASIAQQIGEAKQQCIENFAETNQRLTLDVMMEKYAAAKS